MFGGGMGFWGFLRGLLWEEETGEWTRGQASGAQPRAAAAGRASMMSASSADALSGYSRWMMTNSRMNSMTSMAVEMRVCGVWRGVLGVEGGSEGFRGFFEVGLG